MKQIIGVIPLWDDEKESIWMLPGYLDGIRLAGGLPFIFPFTDDEQEITQLVGLCDGILLTGGHDVSPELYHERPLAELVASCPKRDAMEQIVLEKALEKDRAVLGICRGIQFVNVFLGGTLYQDLPTEYPSETEHHQFPPYDQPVHKVTIMEGTPLFSCLNVRELPVNSYHHQAIKELAPGLEAMAVSEDGLIEAVCLPERKFFWALQWHPEFSWKTDENSRKIFGAFVDAMKRKNENRR